MNVFGVTLGLGSENTSSGGSWDWAFQRGRCFSTAHLILWIPQVTKSFPPGPWSDRYSVHISQGQTLGLAFSNGANSCLSELLNNWLGSGMHFLQALTFPYLFYEPTMERILLKMSLSFLIKVLKSWYMPHIIITTIPEVTNDIKSAAY